MTTGRDPVAGDGVVPRLEQLCRSVTEKLSLSGAAVGVHTDGGGEALLAVSSAAARAWAQLEFDLGEGPATEAFKLGRPVLVARLSGVESSEWPGYAAAAHAAGLCSVFALPLQVGATRLGVLSLFVDDLRQLDSEARAHAFAVADRVTMVLVDANGPGGGGDSLDPSLESALGLRSEVYQAQGAVMAALGVSLPEALALIRAHAFATGRSLDDVAIDVVEGRLHLDIDRPDGPSYPQLPEDVQP